MKKSNLNLIALASLMAASTSASAAVFTSGIATPDGEWGGGIQGQAFTAQENASPDPGAPATVYLTDMSFTQGGFASTGSANVRVDIYGTLDTTLAGSVLVGSSTNTIDTLSGVDNDVYTFDFGGLALDYTETYLAIFKDDTSGSIVGLSIEQGWEGKVGIDEYLVGGATWGYDAFGWSESTNADFTATFSTTAVPVPAAAWLFGSALLAGGLVRRKASK